MIASIYCTDADLTSYGFKTHSCRRTAAYYAAWQKVPETTIKVSLNMQKEMIMTSDFVYIHSYWDDGIHRCIRLMLIVPTSIGGSGRKPALMKMKIPFCLFGNLAN